MVITCTKAIKWCIYLCLISASSGDLWSVSSQLEVAYELDYIILPDRFYFLYLVCIIIIIRNHTYQVEKQFM